MYSKLNSFAAAAIAWELALYSEGSFLVFGSLVKRKKERKTDFYLLLFGQEKGFEVAKLHFPFWGGAYFPFWPAETNEQDYSSPLKEVRISPFEVEVQVLIG